MRVRRISDVSNTNSLRPGCIGITIAYEDILQFTEMAKIADVQEIIWVVNLDRLHTVLKVGDIGIVTLESDILRLMDRRRFGQDDRTQNGWAVHIGNIHNKECILVIRDVHIISL